MHWSAILPILRAVTWSVRAVLVVLRPLQDLHFGVLGDLRYELGARVVLERDLQVLVGRVRCHTVDDRAGRRVGRIAACRRTRCTASIEYLNATGWQILVQNRTVAVRLRLRFAGLIGRIVQVQTVEPVAQFIAADAVLLLAL